MKVEHIIDSITQDRDTTSRCNIRQWMVRITNLHQLMVIVEISNENTRLRAGKAIPCLTGVLKSFVGTFQKLSLCWVHCQQFHRVDSKERMIKLFGILFQKISTLGEHASRTVLIRMIETIKVDFIIFKVGVAGPLLSQEIPEFCRVRRRSRPSTSCIKLLLALLLASRHGDKTHTHSNNGNRLRTLRKWGVFPKRLCIF